MQTLFYGQDHKDRRWLITARPHPGAMIVDFICWNAAGTRKVLDQTSAWGEDGWDLARPWLPASPRPVPTAILDAVERKLSAGAGLAPICSWAVRDCRGAWVAGGTTYSLDEAERAGRAAMAVALPSLHPCKLRVSVHMVLLEVSSDD